MIGNQQEKSAEHGTLQYKFITKESTWGDKEQ